MLVVTGPSGAGKSSLLRAGLLPALGRGTLAPGSQTWPRLVITPTHTPLVELGVHLAALGGLDAAAICRILELARARLRPPAGRLGAASHEGAAGGTDPVRYTLGQS